MNPVFHSVVLFVSDIERSRDFYTSVLKQEIEFYESRMSDLLGRAARRKQLAKAARELGALLKPEKIHSFIYYATMFIGDSQTMTAESAVLGTPAFKCNSFAGEMAVANEIEHKYGLSFSYKPEQFDEMLKQIEELLTIPDLKENWQVKRNTMLKDKIDVTAFMNWFVENFPAGIDSVKNKTYLYEQFKY